MAPSPIAELVGRVLGDRYRLTNPLGAGASAHVYVADDIKLRRRVAVKVLHPALAGDEKFLRRFELEAQMVATLRHPHILRVYDWGDDAGTAYLVMELLEGGSLRAVLDRGPLLSPAQAARVGIEAAQALDYAHRRGLVHRDIKPANLIFDDEGRVTVADFGLARALSEAAWTEPAGAVVGTARYAAPEAVRGETLDNRADVYALALTLAEATTGSVPFATDTTIGTLMGRLDHPITIEADLGPLGPVLEAAGRIRPADRLDAAGLAGALQRAAAALPPPSPLTLTGPLLTGQIDTDSSPTEMAGARARPRLFDIAEVDAANGTVSGYHIDPTRPVAPGNHVAPVDVLLATDRVDRLPPPRRHRWGRVVALIAALALLAAASGLVFVLTRPVPTHPVPVLSNKSEAAAQGVLASLHFHLRVGLQAYDPTALVGTVIAQRPQTGMLSEGSTIVVTLSLGPRPVPVPALRTLTQADAESVLSSDGLKVGAITSQSDPTIVAGAVIGSTPDSGTLLPGQSVTLVVSTGKPTVAVPALSGAQKVSYAAAAAALTAANITATESDQFSDTVTKGQVIGTTPPAGSVIVVQSAVTVNISKGPDLVPVPSVRGSSVGAASQTLSGDGFAVSGVTGNPIATVTASNPPSGALIHRGAAVQLITQ